MTWNYKRVCWPHLGITKYRRWAYRCSSRTAIACIERDSCDLSRRVENPLGVILGGSHLCYVVDKATLSLLYPIRRINLLKLLNSAVRTKGGDVLDGFLDGVNAGTAAIENVASDVHIEGSSILIVARVHVESDLHGQNIV